MLNEAEKKNVYQKLIWAPLTKEQIPGIGPNDYDAFIMIGALNIEHMKEDVLDETIRIVKGGRWMFHRAFHTSGFVTRVCLPHSTNTQKAQSSKQTKKPTYLFAHFVSFSYRYVVLV